MAWEITGKTALVTGGAHRVGKTIGLALARAGANLVVNYHSAADEAERTVAEAQTLGVGALAVKADIADNEQVRAMVAEAERRFGAVDVLVNSASYFAKTPIPTDDVTLWRRVMDILVHGSFFCANAVAPGMLARGAGAIVNIVDLSAYDPWHNFAAHSVGKSALLALTRQLALELAPAVRVNAVAPGPVLPPPDYGEAKRERTAKRTLLGRWGSPDDVAQTVLFLVRSDFITGEVVRVDGGERWGHKRTQAHG